MSRLCRLRNASHGDDGQWAYSEIVGLREQVEFWQKEAAGRRDDMANYTRIVSETIDRLNVEVSKLTKERDELHRAFNQPVQKSEWEKMQDQLAALAEQNEKMREALQKLACLGNGEQYGNSIGNCIAQEALSLPDLASPVLNRIRAEGIRMAAEILIDPMDRAAAQKICAQADELENSNG